MPLFKVADLVLDIDCEDREMLETMKDYQITSNEHCDISIAMNKCSKIEEPRGKYIAEGEETRWLNKPGVGKGYVLLGIERAWNNVVALLDVDANWEQGRLDYLEVNTEVVRYSYRSPFFARNFPGVMFRYHLLKREGIVVHASSIKWSGKGLLFSAPSGTGKTTHAKLWQDCFGSDVAVVNDDTPALRFRRGRPYIFGTPWSGNGGNSNINAPLEAVIILEQSPQNAIRKLSRREAVSHLLPRCFLPFFDESMMNLAIANFGGIIQTVPVYLLQCRPDKEAVEMVYHWVK